MAIREWKDITTEEAYRLTQAEFKGQVLSGLKELHEEVQEIKTDFKDLEKGRLTNLEAKHESLRITLEKDLANIQGTLRVQDTKLMPLEKWVNRFIDALVGAGLAYMGLQLLGK